MQNWFQVLESHHRRTLRPMLNTSLSSVNLRNRANSNQQIYKNTMIRRDITALLACIFVAFIFAGRAYPTTLSDYFRPARFHRRHCPPTTTTGHYPRPSCHHPTLIPFRPPARALPLSLSSRYHELQRIGQADVNGTFCMSDEDIYTTLEEMNHIEEDGWWVVYVTFRVSFLYHIILILPHLFYHRSDDRWDSQPGACAMGNTFDDRSLSDGYSADAILARDACSKHYIHTVRLLFRSWRWDSLFMLFARSTWFAVQPTIY